MNFKTKYRMCQIEHPQLPHNYYKIETKSWWFPFWHNPLNIDAYTTGIFESKQDALDALCRIKSTYTVKVLEGEI